jgi:Na+/phosphate symporter
MNKILQNILIFGLILGSPVMVKAEVVSTEDVVVQPTLAERKQKAGADLRLVISKMNLYVVRTQTAVDRLSEKDIDLSDIESNLTATSKLLIDAKVNLEKFSKIQISETNPDKSEIELKSALKKVEDNLKDARAHLLQSLADLKSKVVESMQTSSNDSL